MLRRYFASTSRTSPSHANRCAGLVACQRFMAVQSALTVDRVGTSWWRWNALFRAEMKAADSHSADSTSLPATCTLIHAATSVQRHRWD